MQFHAWWQPLASSRIRFTRRQVVTRDPACCDGFPEPGLHADTPHVGGRSAL